MSFGSLSLLIRAPKPVSLAPLDAPNGTAIDEGYTGSIGDTIAALGGSKFGYATITFDATPEESHESSADITRHPVELGVDITDHIVDQGEGLSVKGIISDTPTRVLVEQIVGGSFSLANLTSLTGDVPRSIEGWLRLQAMQRAGTVFNVTTSIKLYKNMSIRKLSTSRSSGGGGALSIQIDFEPIRVVDTSGSGDDGTEEEVDLGVLATIAELDASLTAQAALFLGLLAA